VICNNSPQRVYILRGVQRRCVWAVGRLGVAACLACVAAAAVDRQARQSCRVWCARCQYELAYRRVVFCCAFSRHSPGVVTNTIQLHYPRDDRLG